MKKIKKLLFLISIIITSYIFFSSCQTFNKEINSSVETNVITQPSPSSLPKLVDVVEEKTIQVNDEYYSVGNYSFRDYSLDGTSFMASNKDSFIFTWISYRPIINHKIVERASLAQKFDSDGNKISPLLILNDDSAENSYLTAFSNIMDTAMDEEGNFIVVWNLEYKDGDERGIFAQRYDKDGNKIGAQFHVNTPIKNYTHYYPSVVMDKEKNFIIAWVSSSRTFEEKTLIQRYDKDGNKIGTQIEIPFGNSIWKSYSIAMDKDGNFIVTCKPFMKNKILIERFDKGGNKIGEDITIDPNNTNEFLTSSSIAMNENGNFIIVWNSNERKNDVEKDKILMQRYNKEGNKIGENIIISFDNDIIRRNPSVEMDKDGNFAIFWYSEPIDNKTDEASLITQFFDNEGNKVGSQIENKVEQSYTNRPQIKIIKNNIAVLIQIDGEIFIKMYKLIYE